MNKKREEANQIANMELVGKVDGCITIIVDDMIDTAGTLVTCAEVLKQNGAVQVYAAATHALLNGSACAKIQKSCIEKVIITNTVPIPKEKLDSCSKLHVVSIAKLVAEAIRRVHNEESLSILF